MRSAVGAAVPRIPEEPACHRDVQLGAGAVGSCERQRACAEVPEASRAVDRCTRRGGRRPEYGSIESPRIASFSVIDALAAGADWRRRWIAKGVVMEEPKRSIASVWLLAVFLVGQTQAAPFDEKLQTPRAPNSQALRARRELRFATFERKKQDAEPAAFIRDPLAYRQWRHLYCSIKLELDENKPLKGLDTFGLVARTDGKYVIDLRA